MRVQVENSLVYVHTTGRGRGVCKYGVSDESCQFDHPKTCQKLINHGPRNGRGCKLESKCPNYHIQIVSQLHKKMVCLNKECKCTNIRGTKKNQTDRNEETHDQGVLHSERTRKENSRRNQQTIQKDETNHNF